jgi:hypothetical protein
MSGYTKFAVVGAGAIGSYIVQQLLKEVIVLPARAQACSTRNPDDSCDGDQTDLEARCPGSYVSFQHRVG